MEKVAERSEVYSLLGVLSHEAEFATLLVEEIQEEL